MAAKVGFSPLTGISRPRTVTPDGKYKCALTGFSPLTGISRPRTEARRLQA